MADEMKDKMLQKALQQIEKDYGKGAIMKLGGDFHLDVGVIPTGSLKVDYATGINGIPRGRITEIYGPESSGKTTLALHVIAEAQKLGGVAAFVDAEHALDPVYAKKLGVDIDNLLVSQPDNGEQALDIVETLVRSSAIDIIVVDSVAALTPRAEIEGEMGDSHMGLQARLMSQALRKLTGVLSKTNTALIFLNQIRMKIGVMFGNPETTTGGNALKFYASLRMDIRRGNQLKTGADSIGNETKIKVVKNKLAPPFRSVAVDIIYGEGIARVNEIVDLATQAEILEKSGSWYSYNSMRLGQGKPVIIQYLKDNPKLRDEIETKVREWMNRNEIDESNPAGASEETYDEV